MGTFIFDIDGTLFDTNGTDYETSVPNTNIINIVNELFDEGHEIIINTARGYKTGKDWMELTKKQLYDCGVKYHKLEFSKPAGDLYVDDKACSIYNFYPEIDGMEIDKPWGKEYVLIYTDHYAMKRLKIDPDKSISYQYHEKKNETWHVVEGYGTALVDGEKIDIKVGNTIDIPNMTPHTVKAGRQGLVIIEASTTELDDIVRIETDHDLI